MRNRILATTTIVLAVLAAVGVSAFSLGHADRAHAQQSGPASVVEAWAASVGTGDDAAGLATFASGSVGEANVCQALGTATCDLAAGWNSLLALVRSLPGGESGGTFTIVESNVDGTRVTGVFESRGETEDLIAGETTRNRQIFDATVEDGLITRLGWAPDFDDPITARNMQLFAEFVASLSAPEALPSAGTGGLADVTGGNISTGPAAPAPAATARTVAASLSGSAMVPPVDSSAIGSFSASLNLDDYEVDYRFTSNARGITRVNIHSGPVGENGPLVAFLFGPAVEGQDGIEKSGRLNIGTTDSAFARKNVVEDIQEGNAYVVVYTDDNPQGELRGQITTNASALPAAGSGGLADVTTGGARSFAVAVAAGGAALVMLGGLLLRRRFVR